MNLSSTMMFFANAIAFVTTFNVLAYATTIPQGNSECSAIYAGTGYLSAFIGINNGSNQAFDLNTKEELTFGSGEAVQVIFQACPESTPTSASATGRIVVEPTSSNQCLTITNPSASSGPYYVKAKKCTSNIIPSAAQTWGFGYDSESIIYYMGGKACSGGAGVSLDSNGMPQLASGKRVELTCSGVSYESFTLTTTPN